MGFEMGFDVATGSKSRVLDRLRPLLAFALLVGVLVVAGTQPASAGVSGPPVPTWGKAFAPSTIGVGSTSVLTFTIDNTAVGAGAADNMAFTDTLPAGVFVAPVPGVTNTCDGSVAAAPNGNTIALTSGRLGPAGTCTISVNVVGQAIGTNTNTTGPLTSTLGNSGTATADLIVDNTRLGFTKMFSPSAIPPLATSTLTFTIDNNAGTVTAWDFNDPLPSGVVVAPLPNVTTNGACNGMFGSAPIPINITANPGDSSISASVSFWPTGLVCVFSVDVTAASAGKYENVTTPITNSGFATAVLDVPIQFLTKVFVGDPVGPGATIPLRFTIQNPSRDFSATNITFTDSLQGALAGLAPSGPLPSTTQCGGASALAFGSGTLTFAGGSLPAGGSCSFDVLLGVPAGAAPGDYTNNTTAITADINGSPTTGNVATDILTVGAFPTFTKSFTDDPAGAGGTVRLEFTITNPSATDTMTGITFSDPLPTVIQTATNVNGVMSPAPNVCGAGSSLAFSPLIDVPPPGSTIPAMLTLTGGTLAPGGSCTFYAILNIEASAAAGTYPNTTSNITGTAGSTPFEGPPATDNLVVAGAPSVVKTFTNDPVQPGQTVTLEFTISHDLNASADATNISFTDDLNSVITGLAATDTPKNNVCGAGSSITGTTSLSFTGGTLAPGASCTFSVTVQVPAGAPAGPATNTTSAPTATVGGVAVTGLPASDVLQISILQFSKSFLNDPLLTGASSVDLQFTIQNVSATQNASAIFFTDEFAFVLPGLTAPPGTLPATPCGAGSSLAALGTLLVLASGQLAAGASCTFTVPLTFPSGTPAGTYNNLTGDLFATIGAAVAVPQGKAADALVIEDPQPVLLTKQFKDDIVPVLPGGTVDLEFTISNPNGSAVNSLAFTDDLNAALAGLASTSGTQNDVCGTGSSIGGTTSLSFTGGSLAGGANCSFTVSLSVPAGATPNDYVNTTSSLTGSLPGSPYGAATDTLTIAQPGPTVVVSTASPDPTNSTTINFTATFSEAVSGFATGDVTPSGTAGATTATITGGPTVFNIAVSGMTTDGTVAVNVPALVAVDQGTGTRPNQASNTVTLNYDGTKPDVTINQGAGQSDPTNVAAIVFDVVFTEPVTGFGTADVTATNGTVTGVAGTGTTYTVTVTAAADGVVTATVPAGGAVDAVGNTNNASTSTDNSVTYDGTKPDVTINQGAGQADPTNVAAITFDVVFSEPVTGFGPADVTATNGTVTTVSGTGTNYTVTVTAAADGAVTASVPAGGASDAAGNTNNASTSTDNSVTYDGTKPNVTINQGASQADPTNVAAVTFDVVFSEPVTGFGVADVTATNGTVTTVSGTGTNYTVTVTAAADGVVTATVPAGGAADAAGNTNNASTSTDNSVTVDTTAPTINTPPGGVSANNDPGQGGANVDYTVTADDLRSATPSDEAVLAPGSPSCSPASGSFFPIGETTVTCTASDLAGNQSTATFAVRVTDTEAPMVSGPTGPVIPTINPDGTVDYTVPTATDNSGATIPVNCTPPPGSTFPPGNNTVTCTATDGAGNTTTINFVLAVPTPTLPATGGGTSVLQVGFYVLLAGLLLFGVGRIGRRTRLRPA